MSSHDKGIVTSGKDQLVKNWSSCDLNRDSINTNPRASRLKPLQLSYRKNSPEEGGTAIIA